MVQHLKKLFVSSFPIATVTIRCLPVSQPNTTVSKVAETLLHTQYMPDGLPNQLWESVKVMHAVMHVVDASDQWLSLHASMVKNIWLLQPLFQLSQLHVCGVHIVKFKDCNQSFEDLVIKTLRSFSLIKSVFITPINYHSWIAWLHSYGRT